MPKNVLLRFFSYVEGESPDSCWRWQASKTRNGYGNFAYHGRTVPAHRAAYDLLVGPIPDGLQIDHLCRNRDCVNPRHLEAVTASANVKRGLLSDLRPAPKPRPTCKGCGKLLPHRRGKVGRHPARCAACYRIMHAEASRRWWANHPGYQKRRRARIKEIADPAKNILT